jgi:Cu/Ag efflux protein CusF
MLKSALISAVILAQSLAISTLPAQAQSPAPTSTSSSATAQLTAKIIAIDYNSRNVTLQDDRGNTRSFTLGPDVTRFNNLKVGDTVTFTYKESVAVAIVEAGTAMPATAASPSVTKYAGSKPGGEISQTQTTTVTIQAIDTSKPSITVKTQDGRVLSFLVQDPKNLNGVKVGDVVQVTYTQALVVTVK